MDKFWEKVQNLFKNAFATVTKGFRKYVIFFLALFILECMLFSAFLAFQNHTLLQEETVTEEYDYHVWGSGLTEAEMLKLKYDNRSVTKEEMNFKTVRVYEYSDGVHDPSYDMALFLLTDNKGDAKVLLFDSLEDNYQAMQNRYPEIFLKREQGPLAISFSPLYHLEKDIESIQSGRNTALLGIGVFAVIILSALLRVHIGNDRLVYGLYITFGANTKRLRLTAFTELFIIALLTLLPSYYVSGILTSLLFRGAGTSFSFRFLPVGTLLFFLCYVALLLAVSVYIPMKVLLSREPMKMILTADTSEEVSSPSVSSRLIYRSFPIGYEGLTALRFRKHHIFVSFCSAILATVFICGAYLSVYRKESEEASVALTDHFSVSFSDTLIDDDDYALFASLPNVHAIHKDYSTFSGAGEGVHLSVPEKQVQDASRMAKNEGTGEYFTSETLIMRAEDKDLLTYLSTVYTVTGNPYNLLKDEYNALIGKSYASPNAFSFGVGDTIVLSVPVKGSDGKPIAKNPDEKSAVSSTAQGVSLWKEQEETFIYQRITLHIVGVLEDYPGGKNGVPLVIHSSLYDTLFPQETLSQNIFFSLKKGATVEQYNNFYASLRSLAEKVGGCSVNTLGNFFEESVMPKINYSGLIYALSVPALLFLCIIWFYIQHLYYKKRENEFAVLHSLAVPS
ncbi:MAG: hypothetical protein MJ078_03240, partial [Clostridia bacterium]|nr:hypothetical protein [Clostridia bacterium]